MWIKLNKAISGSLSHEMTLILQPGKISYRFETDGTVAFGLNTGAWSKLDSTKNTWNSNEWYYLTAVYNGSNRLFYVNGNLDNSDTKSGNLAAATGDLGISWGVADNNKGPFNGTIDEVIIYNKSLSEEQIKAIYENKTGLIVSQETNAGDVWQACVTPNDKTQDGDEVCSNNLTISTGACNPTLNQDWTITTAEICDNVERTTGTGKIIIKPSGSLTLINAANISANGLEINKTGDSVFINKDCKLIIS